MLLSALILANITACNVAPENEIESTVDGTQQARESNTTDFTLEESKERYSGSTRKGIEAIELRLQGYTGKDIAQKYCVNTNYITACISRAQKYLKKDDVFCRMIA